MTPLLATVICVASIVAALASTWWLWRNAP